MEENKNLTPDTNEENFDIAEAVISEKKAKKVKKEKSPKKPKKIKNQAFLKKGSYSLAITAAVIIGAIIINVLVSALSSRFVLEFDMTVNKDNSISQENIDYIKGIEDEVSVIVCAAEDAYVEYMGYNAQQYYSVYDDAATKYYEQTLTLINKYESYSDKLEIRYVDPYSSSEFTEITSQYMNETVNYGDIIVSSGEGDGKKHRIINYKDVYGLYEDTSYSSYGMTFYTVASNSIETALTSAISYVLTDETKSVALYTGHSSVDYASAYETLLKNNNYDVTVIADEVITTISDEYDAIALVCPTKDFASAELDAIAQFLDNDGNLNKGLMVYADASAPYLTELYDYLSQWGIILEDGIVYETYEANHLPDDPTTIGTYSTSQDDMLNGISACITGNNVPMYIASKLPTSVTITPLTVTTENAVVAPKGTGADWAGADEVEAKEYIGAALATKSAYDSDNNSIASFVAVFSSAQMVEPAYTGYSNETLAMAVTERVTGADSNGIVFTSKYIESEDFASEVTEAAANTMRNIFMWIIPLLVIATAIFIYIRRRNA